MRPGSLSILSLEGKSSPRSKCSSKGQQSTASTRINWKNSPPPSNQNPLEKLSASLIVLHHDLETQTIPYVCSTSPYSKLVFEDNTKSKEHRTDELHYFV
jgi:hypothetical protein